MGHLFVFASQSSVSPAAPPAVPSMARLVRWTPERDVPQLLRKWSLKPPGKVMQFDPLVAKTAFDLIPFLCGLSFFDWFNFQFDRTFLAGASLIGGGSTQCLTCCSHTVDGGKIRIDHLKCKKTDFQIQTNLPEKQQILEIWPLHVS